MKNKVKYRNSIRSAALLIVILNIMFGIMLTKQSKQYEMNTNMKVDHIIGNVIEKYPDVSKEEILNLLISDGHDENNLKEYGIDIGKDTLILKNKSEYKMNMIINILFVTFSNFMIVLIFVRYNKNKNKELDEITNYIEEINKRNYKLNIDDNTEDELSILKNELYKITVHLKEEAELLKDEKNNLKTAIEDISHQLKTPLTSIFILLDNIIEDENMDHETRDKFIKEIKSKTTKINSLIYSLLKLARFDTNIVEFNKTKTKLINIINNSLKNVDLISELKNIKINLDIEETIQIDCDPIWEEEAITNIIKNAIEYSKENSEIRILASSNKIYSKLEITNFYSFINEKDQKRIFDRFYKCNNANSESIGIGLNLSKTIIEKDGGSIEVHSDKEKGTTFTIKYFNVIGTL